MRLLTTSLLLLLAAGLSAAPEDPFERELAEIERELRDRSEEAGVAASVLARLTKQEARAPFRPRLWFLTGHAAFAAREYRTATMAFTVVQRMEYEPRQTAVCLARARIYSLFATPAATIARQENLLRSLERAREHVIRILEDPETGATVRTEFKSLELRSLELWGVVNQLARSTGLSMDVFRELIRRHPEEHRYHMRLVRGHMGLKEWAEALAAVEAAREANPGQDSMALHSVLGQIYSNLDQPEPAEKHFKQFLAANPDHSRATQRLAEHYYRYLDFESGVELYRRLLKLSPDTRSNHHMLAVGLRRLGKTEEAEKHEAILREMEDDSEFHKPPNRK